MYLKVGTYSHAIGEVGLSISKQVERVNGVPRATIERWTISGRLQADDQAGVSAAIQQTLAAYVDGVDFTFFFDDGSESAHKLTSANCVGGTRIIVPPSFPEGRGAEYSTYRNWQAVVEAETLEFASAIVSWNETISFEGGGPEYVFLPVLNGPPIKQLARQQTSYRAVQQGDAVGLHGYPTAPAPFWPADEHLHLRQIVPGSPKKTGRPPHMTYTDYPIRWTYVFEAAGPFIGLPTPPPG